MPSEDPGWDDSKQLARAILHDRAARRKWIARMLMAPVLMLVVGLWGIQDWLGESLLRFALWWGGCAVATAIVMLFALYDALAAIREERDKFR